MIHDESPKVKQNPTTTPDHGLFRELANRFSLVRLVPRGKRPIEPNWQRWCHTRRGFDEIGFRHGENAGIACGPASGVLVIDIDDEKLFNRFLERNGFDLPHTRVHKTGKGGLHFLYQYPYPDGCEYGNRACKADGFDIRGMGGQVVAPGSVHPDTGRPYIVVSDVEPAPAPQWLLDLAREAPAPVEPPVPTSGGGLVDIDDLPISGETRRLIREGAPRGSRSEAIMKVLNALAGAGLSDEQIFALFETAAIGEKYREKGARRREWLAPQVEKARAFVASTPDAEDAPFCDPLPPWPVDIFPGPFADLVHAAAESFNVPVEIPSACLMACVSACLGRVRLISPKPVWSEPMVLWIAIVAPTGTGKSPVLRHFLRPIWRIEKGWSDAYTQASKEFTRDLEEWRKSKNANKGPPPEPPVWHQVVVEDTTVEALSDVIAQNPRGVLWCHDELSGMLLDMDRYAPIQGGTKARLMSSYDAGPWKVNRVVAGRSCLIPHAAVSVFGSIQPGVLPTIFGQRDVASGFLPRFQFVHAQRTAPPTWTERMIPGNLERLWADTVAHLLSLDFGGENRDRPGTIVLSPDAKERFVRWHDQVAAMPWTHADGGVLEPFTSKMRARALRFALLLHELDCFLNRTHDCSTPVAADTMERALALAAVCIAHQARALLFVKGKELLAPAPLHLRVASAIVDLKDQIRGGYLPTSLIADHINDGSDERFRVKSESIGKSARALGLHTTLVRFGGAPKRCVRLSPDDIARLNRTLKALGETVTTVTPVTNQGVVRDCSVTVQNSTVTTVTPRAAANNNSPVTDVTVPQKTVTPRTRMDAGFVTHVTDVTVPEGAKLKSLNRSPEVVPSPVRQNVSSEKPKPVDLCARCAFSRDGAPTARFVCAAPKPPHGRFVATSVVDCPAFHKADG